MKKRGIGSHESTRMLNDEWLTPPEFTTKLGPFDLDPCSPIIRPWPTATKHFTLEDDGLSKDWFGFVWCNPPYGKHTGHWLEKMSLHNNGIVLIFARTETKAFFNHVWEHASSIFFIRGRLNFYTVDGKKAEKPAGAPSCLIGYGKTADERLSILDIKGKYIKL